MKVIVLLTSIIYVYYVYNQYVVTFYYNIYLKLNICVVYYNYSFYPDNKSNLSDITCLTCV